MGQVARIVVQGTVDKPLFNRRACIDLCENVHLHYRNLRLEFPKDEFLDLLKMLHGLDPKEIANFPYAPEAFKEAARIELPETTEYDSRFVVEEQVEGHYHIHYRNLRIELGEMECPAG
jgi:hypothetical protein